MNRVVIIGLGNPWRSDDGIGLVVVSELRKVKLPSGVELVEAGADELSLIEQFKNTEHAIIVDAVLSGKAPGTILTFSADEIKSIPIKQDLDLHSFGLAKTIELARKLKLKTKITIVGIEPESLKPDDKLTTLIQSKIPELISAVMKSLKVSTS